MMNAEHCIVVISAPLEDPLQGADTALRVRIVHQKMGSFNRPTPLWLQFKRLLKQVKRAESL